MKRIIPIILILTLALALSACANVEKAPTGEQSSKPTASSLPSEAKTPTPAPESLPEESVSKVSPSSEISRDRAIEIALADAGLKRDAVRDLEAELDREREGKYWEVDFESGGYDYEYDIDAASGEIVRREKEPDR